MYDTPAPLLELCLDCIVERHAEIFATCYDESGERRAYRFPDDDFRLCGELSERLLARFGARRRLTDSTLNLFRARNTRLRSARIVAASTLTAAGLLPLREHRLAELACTRAERLSVGAILDGVGGATLARLTSLDVSRCSFIDAISRHNTMVHLTHLKQLRSLNVAFTEFNQQTLEMVCEDLAHLERLDVSGTRVRRAEPLLLLRRTLRALVASDLREINAMTRHIVELDALRHLDISLIDERFDGVRNAAVSDVLEAPEKLPHLLSLDLSGWRDLIPKATLLAYIKLRPRMQYLGVVLNAVAFEPFLAEPDASLEQLQVAGLGNEAQIVLALRKHHDRSSYVQKALYHLFQLTDGGSLTESRTKVLELVLEAMSTHPKRFGVQMAATACLYNLTRGEIAKSVHPKHLARAVHLTLDAMERFPDEYQLQKNALLTLCSDRILQDVAFERYRCARVVLDALCAFDEPHMNRMSVAVCSILAAKISTRETSALGARAAYMRKLLAMVRQRVADKCADVTLKFTLSALWNLTDESAATCAVFLEHGGAELFLDALRAFRRDAAVETKVLGLLNNIAEVGALRRRLLEASLVEELHVLLACELIDVSYFAAGIAAHLASDGDEWPVASVPRERLLDALERAVVGWGATDNEMVAYRSFRPFFPLLRVGVDRRVQLWAVWAVHHVCTKNSKRYCDMLRDERGVELLRALVDDAGTHEMAALKCAEVLLRVEH